MRIFIAVALFGKFKRYIETVMLGIDRQPRSARVSELESFTNVVERDPVALLPARCRVDR